MKTRARGDKMKYRVMMFIDGLEVASSCVFIGDKKKSEACAKRLSKKAHTRIFWRALPCAVVSK